MSSTYRRSPYASWLRQEPRSTMWWPPGSPRCAVRGTVDSRRMSRACWTSRAPRTAYGGRWRSGCVAANRSRDLATRCIRRAILARGRSSPPWNRCSRHRRPPPFCARAGAPAAPFSATIQISTTVSSSCAGRSACREDRPWCSLHWDDRPGGWRTRWNNTRSISSYGRGPRTQVRRLETGRRGSVLGQASDVLIVESRLTGGRSGCIKPQSMQDRA